MEELTDRNGYIKASNADGLSIFEATAPWCSMCKSISPFVEKMTKKYPDARFYSYDTDKESTSGIVQELSAHQLPTFHAFKDGDLIGSVTGARAAELEKLIKEAYDGKVVDE